MMNKDSIFKAMLAFFSAVASAAVIGLTIQSRDIHADIQVTRVLIETFHKDDAIREERIMANAARIAEQEKDTAVIKNTLEYLANRKEYPYAGH